MKDQKFGRKFGRMNVRNSIHKFHKFPTRTWCEQQGTRTWLVVKKPLDPILPIGWHMGWSSSFETNFRWNLVVKSFHARMDKGCSHFGADQVLVLSSMTIHHRLCCDPVLETKDSPLFTKLVQVPSFASQLALKKGCSNLKPTPAVLDLRGFRAFM